MYPKLIEIEFRNVEQKPRECFLITVHWFQIFWCDESSMSFIEIASDTDDHGDYVWEEVKYEDGDCYSFRGETYEFMAIRPINTDKIVEVVRSLSEMVEDTTDLDNIYLDSEGKSFPKSKVVDALSTLGYETE